LRAEYGGLTAGPPVLGVGCQWQVASTVAAAHLFAAGRDLALDPPSAAVVARLRRAAAAIARLRGLVARRYGARIQAR